VSEDVRLVIHRTDARLVYCYVDHHDKAYHWASRRKIDVHPVTGSAQIVEYRETVADVPSKSIVPRTTAMSRPDMFAQFSERDLLECGVPEEMLTDVRNASVEAFADMSDRLPAEVWMRLVDLSAGERPGPTATDRACDDAFTHEDAKAHFLPVRSPHELDVVLKDPLQPRGAFLDPIRLAVVESKRRMLANRIATSGALPADSAGIGILGSPRKPSGAHSYTQKALIMKICQSHTDFLEIRTASSIASLPFGTMEQILAVYVEAIRRGYAPPYTGSALRPEDQPRVHLNNCLQRGWLRE